MPVNTAVLKSFAPAMRRQLIEAVGRKLDLLLTSQTPDTLSTYASQIAELRERAAENREQLLEQVAYSWFNRLAALRYLDAKGWHPFGCKVLMPAGEGETQPELLKLMRSGSLPLELKEHTNESRLNGLLDGQIPTAIAGADPQGEVYRELVLAVCRSYHQLLPTLFEGLDDATELLLPDDQITDGSIAGAFRSQISDDDCEDVEIIGWLYQFYISEKKDQVIGKVVKSEDIPAATQLFTPNWIVKYMVQNSLGAQWLATYPDSALKGQMEYYIEPAEQTDEVKAQLAAITPDSLNPEELTLIDPACGSGHILVEAYEVFKAIYLERGYQQREIPQLILEKNLFGLDIDQRAAQLTSFALMMKGRRDDRRLFERSIKLNVMALVNSDGLDVEALANAVNLEDHGLKLADLAELKQLFEHATTFGSLIQVPDGFAEKLPALKALSEEKNKDMIAAEALKVLGPLSRQVELLGLKYNAVVANPPYMGNNGMNKMVKSRANSCFPNAKNDLFACFVDRSYELAVRGGSISMVTMQSWMFLSTFQQFREYLLANKIINSLAHLGSRAFGSISGEVVQTAAFALLNDCLPRYCPTFLRLVDGGEDEKRATFAGTEHRHTSAVQQDFASIPGSPLAYWVPPSIRDAFVRFPAIGEMADAKQGLSTCNNELFLRRWSEVSYQNIGLSCGDKATATASGARWFPYNKGGKNRRWYGNNELLVNWANDGLDIHLYNDLPLHYAGAPVRGKQYYFRPSLTWSALSSDRFGIRTCEAGFIFADKGQSLFPHHSSQKIELACLLNSNPAVSLLGLLAPTLDFHCGYVAKLPVSAPKRELIEPIFHNCVEIATSDWNSYERSWDFERLPFLADSSSQIATLESSYNTWIVNNKQIIASMKCLEEENNRLFIDAYGLAEEITPDVPIEQITLTVNPAYRYGGNLNENELWERFRRDTIVEILSYATGCMMGRYSLDQPGLILADAGDTLENYVAKVGKTSGALTFQPDSDGIIPVLDGEWFEDDIVARSREFLAVTFPESSVADNLRFIEDSLGKDIRKYFCTDFYKDHLQTYKKRPIYWQVQSPKKGFACLIYLHRYTKDTLNLVLNNYFRPYLQKLEARLAQLGLDQLNDELPTRERTAARKEAEKITKVLKECQAWEQDALLPLAQQRIELDLDDGVKVNYLKLQDVLATIPGLAAKED